MSWVTLALELVVVVGIPLALTVLDGELGGLVDAGLRVDRDHAGSSLAGHHSTDARAGSGETTISPARFLHRGLGQAWML
jgi:hypothetical protein